MSINATTSSVGATSSSSSVSNSQNLETTQKSTTDSSFKDEMNKVSTAEKKDEKIKDTTEDDKLPIAEKDQSNIKDSQNNNDTKIKSLEQHNTETTKFASLSMIDANALLTNDIEQMMTTTPTVSTDDSIYQTDLGKDTKVLTLDFSNNLSMTESDAQFFIDLTQNNTVNTQAVIEQAQMALDNGAELSQVQQNAKISETLLNAINTAKENNQPLRIDFDQNVSVILRIGKDGSFAANFIPGDKVVEQYLKNNMDSLKSTFEEKELPYTDLSY
jgi:hypothetical protein